MGRPGPPLPEPQACLDYGPLTPGGISDLAAMQREYNFVQGETPGLPCEKWLFTTWDAGVPPDPHQGLTLTFLSPGVEWLRRKHPSCVCGKWSWVQIPAPPLANSVTYFYELGLPLSLCNCSEDEINP